MIGKELVNLSERARTAISLGESHFREFKSALQGPPGAKVARDNKAVARDIGEALVAFANADGGELLIGVEDDGTVSGIELLSPSAIETLLAAPRTHVLARTPLPPVRTANLEIDGHKVLYFSTQKSASYIHLTSDGRCVQRRDLETVPIPAEEIMFGRRERESREYDRQYVDGAEVNHLNARLVAIAARELSAGMSNEKCLQYLDLAEYSGPGLRIKRAALLLFASEPARWHPRLQLRIVKVDGTELLTGAQYNVKTDQTVTGNILELLEKGWDALRPQLVQTRFGTEARFETTVMYPELACREALVNAIAHRDYSEEGRGIEIYVFDDRMEVRNPGALLSSIRIQDLARLEGIHQSRNASVARVLRELGYMRELGEGMRRMFELMRTNELTPPQLASEANSFCVTLRHQTIYTDKQKLWLDQFAKFDLDREQKAIVVLGIDGVLIAPQDIWDSLGIVDTEHYRQLLGSLQEMGILHSEIPKEEAQRKARQRRISVRKIPRFKIAQPSKIPSPKSPKAASMRSASAREDIVDDSPNPQAKIFIGNISYESENAEIHDFLAQFGELENLEVPRDRTTGRCKGYAFVEYQATTPVDELIKAIDGKHFGTRAIIARRALSR